MESYCSKCNKNTENINPKTSATSSVKTMMLSKCAICYKKKLDLLKIKKQKEY